MQPSPVVVAYLRSMFARRMSPASIRAARSTLYGLERATRIDLDRHTPATLRDWQAARAAEVSARTLRGNISVIRTAVRWAVREELMRTDTTIRLDSPKTPRLLPRPIAEDDLAVALDGADTRMRAILCLAAFAGLRSCEIGSLVWADVRLTGPEPQARVIGKGRREGVVDLSPVVVDALQALPGHGRGPVIRRSDGGPGHCAAARISAQGAAYLHAAGIDATLHMLRHRFVTEVCRHGGLRQAQEAARHASSSTTAGYAEVARRDLRPTIVAAGQLRDAS